MIIARIKRSGRGYALEFEVNGRRKVERTGTWQRCRDGLHFFYRWSDQHEGYVA